MYLFRILLIATGMWKPNIPDYEGMDILEGYEDFTIDPAKFEGKNVLIFGMYTSDTSGFMLYL